PPYAMRRMPPSARRVLARYARDTRDRRREAKDHDAGRAATGSVPARQPALGREARPRDLAPHAVGQVVHDELFDDEVLSEVHIPERRPRLIELLLAVDAVAMQERDVSAVRRALGAEQGLAEPSQVTLRVVHDEKETGVGRDPARGARDPQTERRRQPGDGDQPLYVDQLIDHRHVRLDGHRLLRIPAMPELVDAVPERAGELGDRDAARRVADQPGVCASVSAW